MQLRAKNKLERVGAKSRMNRLWNVEPRRIVDVIGNSITSERYNEKRNYYGYRVLQSWISWLRVSKLTSRVIPNNASHRCNLISSRSPSKSIESVYGYAGGTAHPCHLKFLWFLRNKFNACVSESIAHSVSPSYLFTLLRLIKFGSDRLNESLNSSKEF